MKAGWGDFQQFRMGLVAIFRIISNRAAFFESVHDLCKRTSRYNTVEHVSCEMWAQTDDLSSKNTGYVIADPASAFLNIVEQISGNAFAAVGKVCQNSGKTKSWGSVSRGELVLWLRELSPMTEGTSIAEEIVVQSRHLRLAELRVPTSCRLIPKLRERLMRSFRDYPVVDTSRESQFCMAVEEALNNAFYHGNLEISSELKEDGSSRFVELAAERELLSPWCNRIVTVTEIVSVFGMWLTIKDDGTGFDVAAALKRCDDPEAFLASGRGLLMMRGFTDELIFNPQGNQVTMVLYAEGMDRDVALRSFSLLGTDRQTVVA